MSDEPHRLTIPIELSPIRLGATPVDTLTILASTGQRIVIHTDTGEVDLCGLEPSEGARVF